MVLQYRQNCHKLQKIHNYKIGKDTKQNKTKPATCIFYSSYKLKVISLPVRVLNNSFLGKQRSGTLTTEV